MEKEKKSQDSVLLSEDELTILKAYQEGEFDRSTLPPHDTSNIANAKRFVKKNKFSVLFVILTVILLLAILSALGVMLYKTLKNMPSKADYNITLGEEEYTVPYKNTNFDGIFYFDMCKLASYTDLIASGGNGKMKFTCKDENSTYVRFENGSATATVNGVRVKLGGEAKISGGEEGEATCLIPFSFIQKLFSHPTVGQNAGVRIKYSDKDNTVIIRRVTYENGSFLPISFSDEYFDKAEEMQMEMNKQNHPALTEACIKITMLINKNNPLDEKYSPQGLFSLNDLGCPVVEGRSYQLIPEAAISLTAMLKTLESELGKDERVLVTSAYRSYERQNHLIGRYIKELTDQGMSYSQAEVEVLKTSARPGYSEHQSGLCVDLIEPEKTELDESFEKCAAFTWLKANAHRFGFILRYPKDKTEITGYSYEPWHFRFVGIDAATVIYEDNICLEEYLAAL